MSQDEVDSPLRKNQSVGHDLRPTGESMYGMNRSVETTTAPAGVVEMKNVSVNYSNVS